jgi:uncharacterized tellurite resistance protein B-like protein
MDDTARSDLRANTDRGTSMSFLRKMFSGSLQSDDPRRFLVEAMLAAMEADGDVSDEEMEVLHNNLEDSPLFEGMTGAQISRLVDMAADAIRQAGGGEKRLPHIAKGLASRSHRLAAYAMACDICVSDRELPEAEIRFLDGLQAALEIPDAEAEQLFEAARERSGLKTLEERTAVMRELMPRFVDCMALMAVSDEEIHEEEMVGVRAVLRNIPDMAVLTREELDAQIDKSFERIRGKDIESELSSIAKTITDPSDRYWTTVYMMIVALADGKTDWREVAFLKAAEQVFGLSDAQMDQAMGTATLFPAVELGGDAPV